MYVNMSIFPAFDNDQLALYWIVEAINIPIFNNLCVISKFRHHVCEIFSMWFMH